MRICYLCADAGIPVNGHKGASAHLRGLVGAFRESGHEVLVVSPTIEESLPTGVAGRRIPSPQIVESLHHGKNPRAVRALRHIWNNVAVEQSLNQVIIDFQPNLIYERYSPFGAAGGIVAQAHAIPHMLEVNAPLAWEGKEYRQQALQEAAEVLEEVAFASASSILAVSEELRQELIVLGVSADKVRTIPNGVDTETFDPKGPAAYPLDKDKFVLGFVGSLRPWHGIETLVDAYRQLANDPKFHMLIVGDGPLASTLNALVVELPGRVTLTGAVPQSEVPSFLRAMDVAVAPYPPLDHFYFSPLKVLEYMSTGLPVVASSIGQINDLIQDGETGLLVPPGDSDYLVEAIRRLASDTDLKQRLGSNAAQAIRQEHTWQHRVGQILNDAALGCPAAA